MGLNFGNTFDLNQRTPLCNLWESIGGCLFIQALVSFSMDRMIELFQFYLGLYDEDIFPGPTEWIDPEYVNPLESYTPSQAPHPAVRLFLNRMVTPIIQAVLASQSPWPFFFSVAPQHVRKRLEENHLMSKLALHFGIGFGEDYPGLRKGKKTTLCDTWEAEIGALARQSKWSIQLQAELRHYLNGIYSPDVFPLLKEWEDPDWIDDDSRFLEELGAYAEDVGEFDVAMRGGKFSLLLS